MRIEKIIDRISKLSPEDGEKALTLLYNADPFIGVFLLGVIDKLYYDLKKISRKTYNRLNREIFKYNISVLNVNLIGYLDDERKKYNKT